MNVYFFPAIRKNDKKVINNPYVEKFITELSRYYQVNRKTYNIPPLFDLFINSFSCDTVVLNWIENTPLKRFGYIQYLLLRFIFKLLKLRRVKIIWIMHNIHPHGGVNDKTEKLMEWLYENSSLIVTHSFQALEHAKGKGATEVLFQHHPIYKFELSANKCSKNDIDDIDDIDVLIWGSIEPYKGILEFITFCKENESVIGDKRVYIVGKCNNENYWNLLNKVKTDNIILINKKIEFSELSLIIKKTKVVLFPYQSASISSSGALIDTIALGGISIGPHSGAFIDLEKEGVCLTFNNFSDVFNIENRVESVSNDNIESFIEKNSWENFGAVLSAKINKLLKKSEEEF